MKITWELNTDEAWDALVQDPATRDAILACVKQIERAIDDKIVKEFKVTGEQVTLTPIQLIPDYKRIETYIREVRYESGPVGGSAD